MSAIEMMTLDDFEERALAYGGDLERWPEDEQAAARATVDAMPRARAILEEARAMDEMLDLWEGPEPSQALLGRVLADAATVADEARVTATASGAAPARKAGWRERLFGGGPVFRPGLALAACLALGFAMGTNFEDRTVSAPAQIALDDGGVVDFAFAMEDDSDLLLGPEVLL